MKKIFVYLLILLVIVIVFFFVWNLNFEDSQLKIGVIGPFTGPRAEGGEFMKNALNLAIEDINSIGGLPDINLVFEDSKYEAPVAVSAFNKLRDIDNVHYVIGPIGSSEVLAVSPIAEKNKVILITPSAQTVEISTAGDYIFRTIHNSNQEAPVFAEYLAEKLKDSKLYFIGVNTAITDSYVNVFRLVYEKNGGEIGLVEKFDYKEVDFKTILLKIKAQNPKNIFLIGTAKQEGTIIKQAKDLSMDAHFFGFGIEGPEIIQVAGNLANGLVYPYSYDGHSQESSVKNFRERYVDKFGVEPDAVAVNSYDSLRLLVSCVQIVGDNVDLVKKCLYSTRDYSGVSGIFSIDQNGDAVRNIFIKTVKDGSFVRLE
jgi:branched-chain amino acid transport system substrate-binding protein